MKLISQTLACLSLLSLWFSNLEAKSLEILLDQTPEGMISIDSTACHESWQLKIENLGYLPIHDCLPYSQEAPCMDLDSLAARIAVKPYPILALYQLWSQAVIQDETVPSFDCHPLDLLNFKGTCSPETYALHFVKLCNLLGIKTRAANVHGNWKFDFCIGDDEEWSYLDILKQQHYLGWDNETLVSSEQVMDDPLLALRAKHGKSSEPIDFKENWKALAQFEIIQPTSALEIELIQEAIHPRPQGFELFPDETLLFQLKGNQCLVEHTTQLEKRGESLQWTYHSPFPIQKIVNASSTPIKIVSKQILLQPGDYAEFTNENIFQLQLEFTEQPKGQVIASGICSRALFPYLKQGENRFFLGTKTNPTLVRLSYEFDDKSGKTALTPLTIANTDHTFDYCAPYFMLQNADQNLDKIWWQISLDSQFNLIHSNLDQIETAISTITLPSISETYLTPGNTYYFRIKGSRDGQWSSWSTSFAFKVKKPQAVERAEFDQIEERRYELNWERYAEDSNEPIEYLVFGSNSLDFIPSIYCDKQVNAAVDDAIVEEELNDNLIAITDETTLEVSGALAYYRIIAKKKGQLSIPSSLIHVYDEDLVQPRNVLQVSDDSQNRTVVKRTLFPPVYPGSNISYPHYTLPLPESPLSKIQLLLRSSSSLDLKNKYELPEVDESIWDEVRPYLLPANHPAWSKLNRIFCKYRATLSSETFKKVGFKRYRPGRWSRVSASSHADLKEYFIKAYCDVELGILYDWRKWIHRIKGAETIRQCIKDYKLESQFKVPHKWIYPLPKHPAPRESSKYLRKNFILVAENMRIEEHSSNEKRYKKNMSYERMKGLYIILQVCGLYDSVYCFNIPFCRDGKIAVIDTEYHHKWPVPYQKLRSKFSSKMRRYWDKITYKGGSIPDGKTEPNPPRMDRRDKPEK